MTCHHTTKPHSSGTTPIDILTYRYDKKLVYVPVAPDYIQAISHARDVFPQLKGCDVSLSLTTTAPGQKEKFISISALAWPRLISRMSCYQIVDVQATQAHARERDGAIRIPDITITYADADADDVEEQDPAPPYRGSDVVDDEKASHPRPQSPSSPTLHRKRSWLFPKFHRQ